MALVKYGTRHAPKALKKLIQPMKITKRLEHHGLDFLLYIKHRKCVIFIIHLEKWY